MIAGIQAANGYEIMATANLFVVNYCDSLDSWKVSDLVAKVKKQTVHVRDLEIILNLEEVSDPSGSVVQSVWQIARFLKQRGITPKCVLSMNRSIPAFEVFAVHGLVELYDSVDEFIYEGEASDSWSEHRQGNTCIW